MSAKRWALGCLGIPTLLVSSCYCKMAWDRQMYVLPGRVLASDAAPTQRLASALDVARTLDTYVQPRFEILRDKNFGALRIVYRQHAGLVQLKVDTKREKELIANVNATNRDYLISLLHCAPKPGSEERGGRLEILYLNQQAFATEYGATRSRYVDEKALEKRGLRLDALAREAEAARLALLKGEERQAKTGDWDLLMRPVLATQQSCVGCHKEATRGATLGAMVYAVRRTPRGERTPPREASARGS
jgi:hypothetical protein